ncbi:MAG: 23S rRNA (uracil(1939)-C(5))-methyltransferase RlmD, partial [bacterium]
MRNEENSQLPTAHSPLPTQTTDNNSAPCRHFGVCGGCRTQDIPYDVQLCDKRTALRDLLQPVLTEGLLQSLEVSPSPVLWEYRNRMEFTFSMRDERLLLGLHQRGKYWEIVDLEECLLCPQAFMTVVHETRRFASESGLPAYDKTHHTGFWRYLLVRGTRSSGRVLAEIMTAQEDARAIEGLSDHLRNTYPQLSGLFWSHVPGVGDAPIAVRTEHLFGEPFILETLAGLEVPIGPRTFLQPNTATAEILYSDLSAALDLQGEEKVLDLYCGVGMIGALLARWSGEVVGVEREALNVEMGRELIRRNSLSNFRIIESNVVTLQENPGECSQADVIVVDPPRAGLNKKVLKYLHSCHPCRIAYIYCNPKALKDNLRRFDRLG